MSLGPNCVSKGIALHEIMHLLGFFHEHTRFDRDKYINVLWDNIDPGRETARICLQDFVCIFGFTHLNHFNQFHECIDK